jgi:hypothetical protein
MKSIIGAFTMALLIVCLVFPGLVLAGAEGATATGSFKFALEDGETRYVEFKASELAVGQGSGVMTLSDPTTIPVDDPDNPEKSQTAGMIVRAKIDCMDTGKNTAIMGGEIFESNVPSVIGQRVLLVVEDNGTEGEKDKLTWGVYQLPGKWTPTDAELEDDKGASLTWLATDAESKEDAGIQMPLNKLVQCKFFPGSAYDFPEIKYAGGDLEVHSK